MLFRSWHATPLEASESFLEVEGSRHSPDSPPRGVVLELRPLPSTGVTRLQRYYEPLRHPPRPGLSLAGIRLEVATLRRVGLPVFRYDPVHACRRHYPGGTTGAIAHALQQQRPSPKFSGIGFRITLFEACSAFTRVTACMFARSPTATLYIEGSVEFVASLGAPIATGWSDSCRAGLSPAGFVRLSRRTE